MKKLKVALIFGGTSQEREVSLQSGKNVANNLDNEKYSLEQFEVTKDFSWLEKGLKKIAASDVAFLVLHGPGGEDGTIQGVLESLGVKYTGSGVLASALAMDKAKTKKIVATEGVTVAEHLILDREEYEADSCKYPNALRGKVVIKPNRIGSSLGVTIAEGNDEIKKGIEQAFVHDDEVMIEQFISGREMTVPVIGNKKPVALPVVEIIPKGGSKFFDYRAKYNANFSDEIVPAVISDTLEKQLKQIAVRVHKVLGCRGVTRSDFIVTDQGEIYFLEINTIPGMTENSLTPKSAKAAGMSYSQLLDKIIDLALDKE